MEKKSRREQEFIFYKMEEEEEWKIGRIMKKKWEEERNSKRERECRENIEKNRRGIVKKRENYINQAKIEEREG